MNSLKTNKRGFAQIALLSSVAVIFVVASIVMSFGAKVTSELSTEVTGTAKDAVDNGTYAISKLAKYMPLLALVVAAAIIISVVMGSFGKNR
jgi:uncharacterized protein (UPF0333 family)